MSLLSYKHSFSPKIGLRSKECIDLILKPLTDHVTIKVNGSLTSKDIFLTVMNMSVENNSVHSISKHYLDVACETSLRHHLKKLNIEELIKSNEKILFQELIKILKAGKSYDFTIDLTDDPYYGKIDSTNDENYVINEQAKKSTNSFYSYISLYITNKNERFTVSVLPVEKSKTMVEYLSYLLTSSKDWISKKGFSALIEDFIL